MFWNEIRDCCSRSSWLCKLNLIRFIELMFAQSTQAYNFLFGLNSVTSLRQCLSSDKKKLNSYCQIRNVVMWFTRNSTNKTSFEPTIFCWTVYVHSWSRVDWSLEDLIQIFWFGEKSFGSSSTDILINESHHSSFWKKIFSSRFHQTSNA